MLFAIKALRKVQSGWFTMLNFHFFTESRANRQPHSSLGHAVYQRPVVSSPSFFNASVARSSKTARLFASRITLTWFSVAFRKRSFQNLSLKWDAYHNKSIKTRRSRMHMMLSFSIRDVIEKKWSLHAYTRHAVDEHLVRIRSHYLSGRTVLVRFLAERDTTLRVKNTGLCSEHDRQYT